MCFETFVPHIVMLLSLCFILVRWNIICVAYLQNGPLVGRNESGMIPDCSKHFFNLKLSLFCLFISILINIVFYVSTAVICNKTYLNVIKKKIVQQLSIFSMMNLLKLAYE